MKDLSGKSDEWLVEAIRGDDELERNLADGELERRYGPLLERYAARKVGGLGWIDPPDIVQDTFEDFYRKGDHELMSSVFAGEAHNAKGDPDNMFSVGAVVPGEKAAGPVSETGCKITFPS